MRRQGAQTELLQMSEAVERLRRGMYGNLNRPEAIKEFKTYYPGASIGSGPQKEQAAQLIHTAVMKGDLSVFVVPESTEVEEREITLQVPREVLKQVIRTRGGGLPDHVIRPESLGRNEAITTELLAALSKSALYLRREQFDVWQKINKAKGNWPSQRSSKKSRMGRPPKQDALRNPIVALVNQKEWSGRERSITDLVKLLASKGLAARRDTVRRTVDQLFKETGEQCYRRRERKRRNDVGEAIISICAKV